MIPMKGAGANTAIVDSCDLAEALISAHQHGNDFASVVSTYNEKMIPRGQETVLESRAAGKDSEDTVEGWAKMFGRSK